MKKLFISVPMKDRTVENIKASMAKMHRIAEAIAGEQLEVIDTWIDEEPPEGTVNSGVWYLGKSILMMADADYFIGVDEAYMWKGCQIESMVAYQYDIKKFGISVYDIAQDIEREYCEEGIA